MYPGAPVLINHPYLLDPFGTGEMGLLAYGIVMSSSWDFQTLVGQATVLIDDVAMRDHPWGPSALTDITETNGGYDAANYRLTLVESHYNQFTQNLITYSEDVSQWTANDCSNPNATDMIPDAATTSGQYVSQDVDWGYSFRRAYVGVRCEQTSDADTMWITIENKSTGEIYSTTVFSLNSINGTSVISSSDAEQSGIIRDIESNPLYYFIADIPMWDDDDLTVKIYPSTSSVSQTYPGDGATIALKLSQLQVALGRLRPEYIETDTDIIRRQGILSDDGGRFIAGDRVRLIERGNDAGASLGPLTVASDYETDGARLLTLTGAITGWDAARQWIVVFADYDESITNTQDDRSVFISDDSTRMISNGATNENAYRW
jgi:hypothetical protein